MSKVAGISETSGAVWGRLLRQGWRFDFFQAVWLLERFCGGIAVGGRGPASRERIRFRPDVSVGFPSSDVRRICIRPQDDGDLVHCVDVTFMGLYGVSTPLPPHYAIDILRRVETQAPATTEPAAAGEPGPNKADANETSPVREFLDLFHHRLISLFYRSWTKYRYDVAFGMAEHDRITDYLLFLIGLGPDIDSKVLGLSPISMLRYAGVLTQHPRSSASLEGLVSDYWGGLPTVVEQFVGRWVAVNGSDSNRIGQANSRLGEDLIVGEHVYDRSGLINVAVGPVDWSTYLKFLPDGEAFARTQSLVRLYCCDPLSFTIEVKLAEREVRQLCLCSSDFAGRLGYTSWLRTGEMTETSVTFGERGAA